jgi:hypothetical protein
MSDDPVELLRKVVKVCEAVGTGYAVIGAVARNAWAPPRATADLDLAVSVTAESYEPLIAALRRGGLTVKRTIAADPAAPIPDIVLLEADSGIIRRVDLLIAKTPFEQEAIVSAVSRDIGAPCRVVRPEHLIVYKLIAGRPRDMTDAEEVMRTCALGGNTLDLGLIEKWAVEWGVEARLHRLLHGQEHE